ncbi:Lin0512 family protein [Halomonas sp. M20]|uniref:Lin0512 family protein n=1 Tax=Halomonas sp. M20 TaxID=2763264 RepID=UPI001D0A6A26|nr:Lin0512 family protein [Halomonas sp. M20]
MAEQMDKQASEKRVILEMGTGNDLYGGDYTKAASRAIQDALHHSSIVLFKSLGYDHSLMRVQVTIGVQEPDKVDTKALAAGLPRGRAEVTAVKGGLNIDDPEQGTTHIVATAAVEAFLPDMAKDWRLTEQD